MVGIRKLRGSFILKGGLICLGAWNFFSEPILRILMPMPFRSATLSLGINVSLSAISALGLFLTLRDLKARRDAANTP